MQRLIILRGCPASGKSTIAKKFRDTIEKTVWLKVDAFKDFFNPLTEEAMLPFANGAALAVLPYFLDHGFSVVMEGVFQDTAPIMQAAQVALDKNIPVRIFQLSVPLEILQERDKNRAGVKEGLRQPLGDGKIASLYQIVTQTPVPGAIELNTEINNVDACHAIIESSFLR